MFRSDDGGETWTRTNDDRNLRQRAWYYTHIYADPKDEEGVYVLNVQFHRSNDGGKTFTTIRVAARRQPRPLDRPRRSAADDRGQRRRRQRLRRRRRDLDDAVDNQPTAQFYRVSTDNHFPYRVLGAQQDNSAVRILVARRRPRHRRPATGSRPAGGESGYIVADPTNPDIVFGGSYGGLLTRFNHDTGEFRDINAWPDDPMGCRRRGAEVPLPVELPDRLLAARPEHALRGGQRAVQDAPTGARAGQAISPDLTRNDKSRQGSSGGPITKDNTGVEYYGTIFAVAESPLEPGVIWAGSDDGLVHVTRDGGKTWKNVTPKGIARVDHDQRHRRSAR